MVKKGIPGTLHATVTYTLKASNELVMDFAATTDKPTIVNLTAHSYFNLAGATSGKSILDHLMMIDADRYTPVDNGLITTGELKDVTGTPMDFRTPTAIGARIGAEDPQLHLGPGGYDHNWVLNSGGKSLAVNARVVEETTGTGAGSIVGPARGAVLLRKFSGWHTGREGWREVRVPARVLS